MKNRCRDATPETLAKALLRPTRRQLTQRARARQRSRQRKPRPDRGGPAGNRARSPPDASS